MGTVSRKGLLLQTNKASYKRAFYFRDVSFRTFILIGCDGSSKAQRMPSEQERIGKI